MPLPVSQEFLERIKADKRNIVGKIEITWTDPYLDQSIQVTTNEEARISWPNQVADSVESIPFKWASLDGSWVLDGTYHLAPETKEAAEKYQMGWWGKTLSGVGGAFSAPYPQLTVRFFPRPVFGLKVVGDDARGEYPVDFEIRLYDETGALAHTETVTGNDAVSWQKDISNLQLSSITKTVLEIHKWSHENRQVKISEFFTSVQEIYEDDDILQISLLEEREISQGSLPIGNISSNEIDIKLNNIDDKFHAGNIDSPLHQLIKKNRKIRAWLGLKLPEEGLIEYIPLGTFWSGDWLVPEQETYAATSGRDRLELLRKTTFSTSQVYINKSLYDLAIIVLEDAGVDSNHYWVDTELQEFVIPYAYFEPVSHREALRQIVEACMGQCYADRNDVIRVEGPSFIQLPERSDIDV